MLNYHESLDKADPSAKKTLRDMYPHITDDSYFELLEGMLSYNAHFRWTATECLQHKVFDEIRVRHNERPSTVTIDMPVYAEGSYDYDSCTSESYGIADFKKMIIEEVDLVRASSPLFVTK